MKLSTYWIKYIFSGGSINFNITTGHIVRLDDNFVDYPDSWFTIVGWFDGLWCLVPPGRIVDSYLYLSPEGYKSIKDQLIVEGEKYGISVDDIETYAQKLFSEVKENTKKHLTKLRKQVQSFEDVMDILE